MATYGRGQMLGSGINPESFKQDYSGFTRAAEMQAQGMADLGASIGGAIKDFAAEKKQINQDIAKGKSALQFAKANYPELAGRIDEIGKIFSDVNVSKAEQAAAGSQMGDFVAAMIRGQEFNKEIGLQERILGIQEAEALARNAPPMPERFGFTGSELKKTDKGGLYVLKGNDGLDYDPKTKLPIFDLAAFGEGLPPEVWSGSSTFSDDLGDLTTPRAFLPGESPSAAIDYANSLTSSTQTGSSPTSLNVSRPAPFISPSQIESAANIGTNPLLGSRSGDNSDLPAIQAANQAELQPRYITDEGKAEGIKSFRRATPEEAAGYGATAGQIDEQTNRFYPINLPSGMTVESDGQGGIKVVQGAGVGAKAEGVAKAQEQVKVESFRLNQANTEEAFGRLDAAGTNNPLFAAGNSLLAKALPASEVGELESFFDRINSENSFIKMNQQRASSPTGGSAGSMTEKEWPRYEGRFSPLKANAKKDTLAKSLSLNLLNSFEAVNGTPDDVIKLLEEKKIDQATYDNYVSDYVRNRQIARVNANGVEGKSYDWTKLNKKLLSKSTIFEAPATSGVQLLPDEQQLIDKYKTK
jgi:hypothetical protein